MGGFVGPPWDPKIAKNIQKSRWELIGWYTLVVLFAASCSEPVRSVIFGSPKGLRELSWNPRGSILGTFWGDNSGIIVMIVLLKTIEKPSEKTKSKPAGTSKSKQQPNRHILPYRPIPDVLFAARRCKSARHPLAGGVKAC